jgi:hypothetical protein
MTGAAQHLRRRSAQVRYIRRSRTRGDLIEMGNRYQHAEHYLRAGKMTEGLARARRSSLARVVALSNDRLHSTLGTPNRCESAMVTCAFELGRAWQHEKTTRPRSAAQPL